ncbi:MAG: DUF1549 and DUF1553 domain-containing protein [Gemmataceae bacterium]
MMSGKVNLFACCGHLNRRPWLLLVGLGVLAAPPAARGAGGSFTHDVMAVLSKAGCNMGACHGNQNGKGGFKLSLRGEDPAFDFQSLTRDTLGRRINPLRPEDSLILGKATATVPHEGGRRFAVDSLEYGILMRWIAAGAPADAADRPRLRQITVTPRQRIVIEPAPPVRLRVAATFSDGSQRDVTRLAVYEASNSQVQVTPDGLVRHERAGEMEVVETAILVRYLDRQETVTLAFVPEREDFVWQPAPEANFIDRHVFAKLKTLRIQPSEVCSDSVFIRRLYLDVLGILPTSSETRAFLNDPGTDKRARLIDQVLRRPEFADYWALKWADLLRNEEKTLDRKGVQAFHRWIRQCLADGKPLNEFARELIAARGSTYQQPAANYYRALREPFARAETTAQVFLGLRMQCAKCHNHPFDRWTQHDYHSLAAFFTRVQYRIVSNDRKDRFDSHEFDGEQIVWMAREGEATHPRTGATLPPRLLDDGRELSPQEDRLLALADWVADPTNPFFARTQVNRVWYHLLGRGIVEPIDDFRASNPPVNAPLLDALSQDFIDHDFDLRHLLRVILNSRTYQLSAVPTDSNRADETNFSHALIRPLPAEPLLDALSQVTGVPAKFNGYPLGTRAGQLPGVRAFRVRDLPPSDGERFLRSFGKPERLLSCECERSADATLGQAFQLITGALINQMLSEPNNRIGQLLSANRSTAAIIDEFYLFALSRPPSAVELEAAVAFVDRSPHRRQALEDIVWGLLNAKEFLLRR